MQYKVKFVGYGYIEADCEEEALLSFCPYDDGIETENISATEIKKRTS